MTDKDALFEEIDAHILTDGKPSLFLQRLDGPLFEERHPFTMLSGLKMIGQSPRHHPEGSVWNHTMLVLDEAAARKAQANDMRAFMWGALLHDIGKSSTTKVRKGKITAFDHDKVGASMTREFLSEFETEPFISAVTALVRWHMQILYVTKAMRFADLEAMRREADVNDVALLCLCDRLGRGQVNRREEEQNVRAFLRKANQDG